MKRLSRGIGVFDILAVLGIFGVLGGASPLWAADPIRACLPSEQGGRIAATLKGLIELRQTLEPFSWDRWNERRQQHFPLLLDLRDQQLTDEAALCLGFEVTLRRVHPSLRENLLGRMLPAFLL